MLAAKYHDVNVLVNNAGVHNECSFKNGIEDFSKLKKEIETNFIAPVMLAEKFIPLLISHERAAIINITSYFGISPKPSAPIYSATKAAMRSFFCRRHAPRRERQTWISGHRCVEAGNDLGWFHSTFIRTGYSFKNIGPSRTHLGFHRLLSDNAALFCRDAAMNGFPSVNRIIIWIENLDDYRNSWDRMIKAGARMIFPSHGKPFPSQDLEKYRPYLKKIVLR